MTALSRLRGSALSAGPPSDLGDRNLASYLEQHEQPSGAGAGAEVTSAGAASRMSALPQPPQKRAAGSFRKPQLGYALGSGDPQPAQKRRSYEFSAEQLGHSMRDHARMQPHGTAIVGPYRVSVETRVQPEEAGQIGKQMGDLVEPRYRTMAEGVIRVVSSPHGMLPLHLSERT